ncbi:hypothetical protein BXZ70DRAFT_364238 [Cristinia sonorae]|uniref:MYND-type domain-containing protein n=1 Tax=Cristinia sonorae TaxID=1940300 RepID=A0A8K0XMR1_9AGAR|nr:hypothetical protein BXZ70DRAFT_364238 [Cristinia sonorae]
MKPDGIQVDGATATLPPPTRFGLKLNDDWSLDISSVDWDQVVRHEPYLVAKWIAYLHQNEHPASMALLNALSTLLASSESVKGESTKFAPQWSDFFKSNLVLILMDIASEPDMFGAGESTFRNSAYGETCLSALSDLLFVGTNLKTWKAPPCSVREIVLRADLFFQRTWERRHLIGWSDDDVTAHLGPHGIFLPTFQLMLNLTDLYYRNLGRCPLFSTFAAHVLLYMWAYPGSQSSALSDRALDFLNSIVREEANLDNIQFFVDSMLTCDKNFARHFHTRLCQDLQAQRTVDGVLNNFTFIVIAFARRGLRHLSPQIMPNDTSKGIIPSLILACRRQICCSKSPVDAFSTGTFTQHALQTVSFLLEEKSTRDAATKQYARCLVDHNFVAILSQWLARTPEYHASQIRISDVFHTLKIASDVASYNKKTIYPTVQKDVVRVWYDTLKSLQRIQPKGNIEIQERKDGAIEMWQFFGRHFGITERQRPTTLQKSSELSKSTKYWKIPQKCFSNVCPCAAAATQHHPMRVCKGCYRVLYCSRTCQQADWKLGHNSLCKAARVQ